MMNALKKLSTSEHVIYLFNLMLSLLIVENFVKLGSFTLEFLVLLSAWVCFNKISQIIKNFTHVKN